MATNEHSRNSLELLTKQVEDPSTQYAATSQRYLLIAKSLRKRRTNSAATEQIEYTCICALIRCTENDKIHYVLTYTKIQNKNTMSFVLFPFYVRTCIGYI